MADFFASNYIQRASLKEITQYSQNAQNARIIMISTKLRVDENWPYICITTIVPIVTLTHICMHSQHSQKHVRCKENASNIALAQGETV